MNAELILSNILNPPVLFFFLGMIAYGLKSDLEVPQPLPKLFSLYLLLSIGFKGGVELNHSGLTQQVALTLGAAVLMAMLVPVAAFFFLKRKMDAANAAAVAAAYGSVSAVTFIAATAFLEQLNLAASGHMVAAMALMESPAIIIGILLARMLGPKQAGKRLQWKPLLHDAFCNGSVLLLMGALLIGILTGAKGGASLAPFTNDLFKGMLCLFLLDMGIVSARQLGSIRQLGTLPILFAVIVPVLSGSAGIAISALIGLSTGDALLFAALCASASYIAVPAAMRLALPEANPGLYVTMALAITFPFNVVVGLPLYLGLIRQFWP
jgi:hypothetical protein